MPKLTFLGAAGTVTGSKYLVEAEGKRLLVDCGLFQGLKELRLRNWNALPEKPVSFDWCVLTHAHLDHTGYLPRLVRDGFRGPIYADAATVELCNLLLPTPLICRRKIPTMPHGADPVNTIRRYLF